MPADNSDEERSKKRKAWLCSLLAEMEKMKVPLADLAELDETAPQWLHALEKQFALAMFPAAKLKKGSEITPKRFGALLGHQCAMAVWMMDWLQSDDAKKLCANSPENFTDQTDDSESNLLLSWYQGMRRLAKKALCSSVDQYYEEMSEFLIGFADGFRRKPHTFKAGDLGNTAFEIHFFMRMFWKAVARLNSISQLHQVLVKMFGAQRVGDLKRVEKICQRIGLTFREPGRPKREKRK